MRVFQSPLKTFGEVPLLTSETPLPSRVIMTRARSTPEKGYWLKWSPVGGAVAFHIFRSRSVTMVEDASAIAHLWRGTLDSMELLSVGGSHRMVVDRYQLRGDVMFYYVLAQLSDGTMTPVTNLQVSSTSDAALNLRPLILEVKKGPSPAELAAAQAAAEAAARAEAEAVAAAQARAEAEAAAAAKARAEAEAAAKAQAEAAAAAQAAQAQPQAVAAQPKQMRSASIIPYQAPGKFQIVKNEGEVIQQYELYLGSIKPNGHHCDAFWDGGLHPSCQMRGFKLPPTVNGFTDKHTAEGNRGYLVIFGLRDDGTRFQPDLVAPSELPSGSVELT